MMRQRTQEVSDNYDMMMQRAQEVSEKYNEVTHQVKPPRLESAHGSNTIPPTFCYPTII